MDLTVFLTARIAEDEQRAQAAAKSKGTGWEIRLLLDGHGLVDATGSAEGMAVRMWPEVGHHLARWDPTRVLAECEAKRRIVEDHEAQIERRWASPRTGNVADGWSESSFCTRCVEGAVQEPSHDAWPCLTLRALALPYADHLDYQEVWRP